MLLNILIIAVCLGVGFFIQQTTPEIDSPSEQVTEAVLKSKGVQIDFSKNKKINKAKEKTKEKDDEQKRDDV